VNSTARIPISNAGVAVAVAVGVLVRVGVLVGVGVDVGVDVAVGVYVGVGVRLGVGVELGVGVCVGVRVMVDVGVGPVIVQLGVGITTPPPMTGQLFQGFHATVCCTPSKITQ